LRYFFISTFISLRTAYTILGSVLGSKNESFFDPFDLTSMMLLLIVVYTNQKNFTAIILQAIQIIFLFNLLHCLFCGMPPLQFNNQSRQITISIWLKYNICKPFSSWHFPMQGIVLLSRVVCQGNHTRQCIFIVVFQDGYICLMYLFDLVLQLFVHHKKE